MKRDWEIIRAILLKLEESSSANAALVPGKLPEFSEQEVAYNMRLLVQGGYIEGSFRNSNSGDGAISSVLIKHLTNSGHDLLDAIRSDTVWTKTKDKFATTGVEMTIEAVVAVAKRIMSDMLGI